MSDLHPKEDVMKTRSTLCLSKHANHRELEREVPSSVLEELRTSAKEFLGHHRCHRRVWLRIVRQGDIFWIAPSRNGGILTVYAKQRSDLHEWANTYLVNPDQNRHRLALLPNHRTTEEVITDELMSLWALDA
jgi:hypothetical protein